MKGHAAIVLAVALLALVPLATTSNVVPISWSWRC